MTLNVIFVWKINDVLAERKATADEQALDELQALPAENKRERGLMRISAAKTKKSISIEMLKFKWRRGRDSNSGWGRPHDGFQDRCIKPLCHLSMMSPFTDKLFTENFIKGQALFCILHIFFIMNRDADLIKEKNS